MNKHKILSLGIIFIMTITLFVPLTVRPALAAPDDLRPEEPKLVIGADSSIPVIKAGEKTNLVIPVKNTHRGEARNVIASMVVDDIEKFPFELDKMSTKTTATTIGDYSWESIIFYDVKVASHAESKIYPININLEYTSENGNEGQVAGTIYVRIENDQNPPQLKLMGLQLEQDKLDSGNSSTIQLRMKNDGHLTAYDVELQLSGFASNAISLEQDTDTWTVKEFKGQEFKYVPYKIHINSAVETGTHMLDLAMKYKDANNKEFTGTAKVYLPIEGSSGDGVNQKAVPRLIIDNYNYGFDFIQAGQAFDLSLSFLNTHQSKNVNNIKVSWSADENIFSPVNSSNSFYIAEIPAGEAYEKILTLRPKIDAANKTYNINVEIEYEDDKGNKYTEKGVIGIAVTQEMKLTLAELQLPPESYTGSPTGISVDYYNTGRALVRNLKIRTQGDFTLKDAETYVGNLEAGKTDYYDVTIIPEREGELAGKIIFSYEDEIGNYYEQEKDFTLVAMEQPMPRDMEMMGEERPEPQEKSSTKKWLIGAGILVPVALLTIWIVKKKRREKQEALELDE